MSEPRPEQRLKKDLFIFSPLFEISRMTTTGDVEKQFRNVLDAIATCRRDVILQAVEKACDELSFERQEQRKGINTEEQRGALGFFHALSGEEKAVNLFRDLADVIRTTDEDLIDWPTVLQLLRQNKIKV